MRARRGQPGWMLVAAISATAHLALFVAMAWRLASAPPPVVPAAETIIPVILPPKARPDRAVAAEGRRAPSPVRRLELRAAAEPAPPGVEPLVVAEPAAGLPEGMRATLRARLGCANPERLSREERTRCETQLAHNAAQAPRLPIDINPVMRAYYEAVAEAKKPAPPPVPAEVHTGLFDTDLRGTPGHGPRVGCKVRFGAGRIEGTPPPNSLTLGPCFIQPPAGSLSKDVDILHPDKARPSGR